MSHSPASAPHIIVVGNEKGGAGKSTLVMHIIAGLLHDGLTVALMDLDLRQRSVTKFVENRRAWLAAAKVQAPLPTEAQTPTEAKALAEAPKETQLAWFGETLTALSASHDVVVIDTPGGDTALTREAHARADLIVTPINDSFVDFDLLGVVDPVTLEVTKPSIYAETVWEARKRRAVADGKSIDWIVLRNRLATTEARNKKRLGERIATLSRRVGFRVGPGLRDRVIYRELFPFGLTIADLSPTIRPVAVSLAHVAARQELRALLSALNFSAVTSKAA